MRYHPTENILYRDINYSNPDERTALWIMHHATQALLDATLSPTSRERGEERDTLRAIVEMAHQRIDTLTAILYS